MVARSRPVGINPRPTPPKPKTDEDRLRELREAVQRHTSGLAKAIADLAELELKRKLAA